MALHLSMRPTKFKQVLGNDAVVAALKNALSKKERPHAYLFHGPAGCGKTTLARIVKNQLGCADADFREINAADARGIDDSREILRSLHRKPMAGPVKVFLVDECHQLTAHAQDNLLKDLEEPPEHVFFLFCTTEPGKLKKTVRSRFSEYALRELSDELLEELIDQVQKKESCKFPKEVRKQVILDAQGSARSLLTTLDKIAGMDKKQMLEAAARFAEEQSETIALCRALLSNKPWKSVGTIVKGLTADPEGIRRQVLGYMQSVLLNGDNKKAAIVMSAFSEPFYDLGKPGLTLACYDAVKG